MRGRGRERKNDGRCDGKEILEVKEEIKEGGTLHIIPSVRGGGREHKRERKEFRKM